MKIETKYQIGQKIWIVYECQGEVNVFDDIIEEIIINKNCISYFPANR